MKPVLVSLGITHLVCCFSKSYFHASHCSTSGDAIMLSRFIHTLSQFYQGLSPEFAPPTFKKHHFPMLSRSIAAVYSSLMLIHPPSACDKVPFAGSHNGLGHLMWRINNHDLERLRSTLSAHVENKKLLSKHDCLVAYIIAILNYNRVSPIQKVWIVSSVR